MEGELAPKTVPVWMLEDESILSGMKKEPEPLVFETIKSEDMSSDPVKEGSSAHLSGMKKEPEPLVFQTIKSEDMSSDPVKEGSSAHNLTGVEEEEPLSPKEFEENDEEVKPVIDIVDHNILEESAEIKVMKHHSGMNNNEVRHPTFKKLEFLMDHTAPRNSISNLDLPACSGENTESSYKQSENSMTISEDTVHPTYNEDGRQVSEDDLISRNEPRCPENQAPRRPGTSKRKKSSPEEDLLACATRALSNISAEDADDEFGKFVASQLRQINNKIIKMNAQHAIINVLIEKQAKDNE